MIANNFPKTKKVLLLIPNGAEELEISAFTDVMGWSRAHGTEPVELVTTGLHKEIKCAWNLRLIPELLFDHISTDDFDALAIPGGFETAGYYEDAFDERTQTLIRAFHSANKPIASICVAALALGKAGILQEKNATTYDLPEGNRQQQLADFGALIKRGRVVIDGTIITSTGPATALDVAFVLLQLLTNKENVKQVKHYMRNPCE